MGSLKFAIGSEPPSLRILPASLYVLFPAHALVLLIGVLKVFLLDLSASENLL